MIEDVQEGAQQVEARPDSRLGSGDDDGLRSEAVATLAPRDVRIFQLAFGRALSLTDTAHALGVSVPHARRTIARVGEELREGYCAVVLARGAGTSCRMLAAIVAELGEKRSPRMRRTVLAHARGCAACRTSAHPVFARALDSLA